MSLLMEGIEMTRRLSVGRVDQAHWHLDAAKAAFNKAAPIHTPNDQKARLVAEAEEHAKRALRLAGGNEAIKALANIQGAKCHELQDKYSTAWHEYEAAKDQAGMRWPPSLEHRRMFCYRKTHPR